MRWLSVWQWEPGWNFVRGTISKVRIAAYIRPTRMYVLVNRNGTRTAQFDRTGNDQAHRPRKRKGHRKYPVFERSLESVIQHLRQADLIL